MIAVWLLSTALAQEGTLRDCGESAPIVGTSGYRNARAAMTTNAQTYGAASFAERALFPAMHAEGEANEGPWISTAIENSLAFTAARVPSVELDYPGPCPADHRLSMRGLDLGSAAFGLGASFGPVGVFYAGSATWSNPAHSLILARGMLTGSYLGFGWMGASLAPALMGFDVETGLLSIQTDFLIGASVDAAVATAEVGYVGSTGGYAHVRESNIGFFGSGLVKSGRIPFFRLGAEGVQSPAGQSALYVRRLPIDALPGSLPDGTAAPADDDLEATLQTLHLEQHNLGDHVDLLLAGRWTPDPDLYQLQAAFHSRGYSGNLAGLTEEDADEEAIGGVLVQGGVVDVPDAWYYGVRGGIRPTARLQAGAVMWGYDGSYVYGNAKVLFNDPELLALYPFSVNAVAISWEIRVAL